MNEAKLLAKAIQLATIAHLHQTDKSGAPYILHPMWVMNELLKENPGDWHLAALGIMHDCKEDHPEMFTDVKLLGYGFGMAFILELNALTHDKGMPYLEYVMLLAVYPRCVKVKKKDLEHNSKIFRMKGISQKDFARLEKYHNAYAYLQSV